MDWFWRFDGSTSWVQARKLCRFVVTNICRFRIHNQDPGHPEGLEAGYFVKPTVFVNVKNDMTIAREEIFGPVLCVIAYDSEDEAIRIAND